MALFDFSITTFYDLIVFLISMNYKNIIKSRALRLRLLTFLDWIPDSIMLKLQYRLQTGRNLNLKTPKRFTEKLQLYKLKYHNPDMLRCTDKYEVRKYIYEKGLGEYLIPLIGVYDKVSDIDFDMMPNHFVAKTTDGGGGSQVLICKDKGKLKEKIFRDKLESWMSARKTKKQAGREWAYENGFPRRILIEELIGSEENIDLCDYKFFCFGGKVVYIYGISDRKFGQSVQLGIYDRNFNKLDVSRNDERPQKETLQKPLNFDKMKMIAEILSKDFPHVRVDLYNVNGKIYFGELTFYDGSGYMSFTPDSFDEEMGNEFDITQFV